MPKGKFKIPLIVPRRRWRWLLVMMNRNRRWPVRLPTCQQVTVLRRDLPLSTTEWQLEGHRAVRMALIQMISPRKQSSQSHNSHSHSLLIQKKVWLWKLCWAFEEGWFERRPRSMAACSKKTLGSFGVCEQRSWKDASWQEWSRAFCKEKLQKRVWSGAVGTGRSWRCAAVRRTTAWASAGAKKGSPSRWTLMEQSRAFFWDHET